MYGKAMLQKLPIGGFKSVRNKSKFNEDFIKNYNEDSKTGYLNLKQALNHEIEKSA